MLKSETAKGLCSCGPPRGALHLPSLSISLKLTGRLRCCWYFRDTCSASYYGLWLVHNPGPHHLTIVSNSTASKRREKVPFFKPSRITDKKSSRNLINQNPRMCQREVTLGRSVPDMRKRKGLKSFQFRQDLRQWQFWKKSRRVTSIKI